MYHRYVEFRPFIKAMFTDKGVRGFILNKALHHQHNAIYKYDRSTVYGCFDEPGPDMTAKFLALAHHDSGGRIFTYIITLDGLFRFTETGKEFGIDFLSKHTMHSDVNIYIAFSGEFFIRRRNSLPAGSSQMPADAGQELKSPSAKKSEHSEPLDIDNYELYIDNDSGTYRPAAKLLPTFKEFLERNFPGLAINTLDCQGDADKMKKMKEEQREKKAESKRMVFHQGSISGSISSSDEEALEHLEAGHEQNERGALHQVKKVIVGKGKTAVGQAKDFKPGRKEGKKNNPVSPLDIDADAKE